MSTAISTSARRAVARPLKILVPLIKEELTAAHDAGLEHYRRVGDMLIEAKMLVSRGSWQPWLNKNFQLSYKTATRYMSLAEKMAEPENGRARHFSSLSAAVDPPRDVGHRPQWYDPIKQAVSSSRVDTDALKQERQTQSDEVKLHRDLALELVDIGYKVLATRLHPDKGGSRDAMRRLNRVREELKDVAATRRFA